MTLLGHLYVPTSISFSPNGNQLVSDAYDQTVRLWDVKTGKQIHLLEDHKAYVRVVRFSPDGQHFLSGSTDGTARLWDAKTGKCVHIFKTVGPYEGTNITGVTGITEAQRAALRALGAAEG